MNRWLLLSALMASGSFLYAGENLNNRLRAADDRLSARTARLNAQRQMRINAMANDITSHFQANPDLEEKHLDRAWLRRNHIALDQLSAALSIRNPDLYTMTDVLGQDWVVNRKVENANRQAQKVIDAFKPQQKSFKKSDEPHYTLQLLNLFSQEMANPDAPIVGTPSEFENLKRKCDEAAKASLQTPPLKRLRVDVPLPNRPTQEGAQGVRQSRARMRLFQDEM